MSDDLARVEAEQAVDYAKQEWRIFKGDWGESVDGTPTTTLGLAGEAVDGPQTGSIVVVPRARAEQAEARLQEMTWAVAILETERDRLSVSGREALKALVAAGATPE